MKGLKGCAYLDPGAITNALSYVFGPFIETLEDAGYIDEVNLNAVPVRHYTLNLYLKYF